MKEDQNQYCTCETPSYDPHGEDPLICKICKKEQAKLSKKDEDFLSEIFKKEFSVIYDEWFEERRRRRSKEEINNLFLSTNGIKSELHDVAFDNISKVHDWRNYVPENLRPLWKELPFTEKQLIYYFCKEKAEQEVWD